MITLRQATISDGEALAKIYKYYVENTAITFEYIAPTDEEFSKRIAHKSEKYPFIVAEENGTPVGYAYASEYRERAAYSWDVETSVYVDREFLGRGIGKRLCKALEEILKLQHVVNLYACVTYPNERSISMHESLGYNFVGKFHAAGFKNGEWHDVCWLEKQIISTSSPLPIIPYPLLDNDSINKILMN